MTGDNLILSAYHPADKCELLCLSGILEEHEFPERTKVLGIHPFTS